MCETLNTLADVRAETLHVMKVQENNAREHDEIFARLRQIETDRAACSSERETDGERIDDLEDNQKWGVITVLAGIIGLAIKKLFWG